MALTQVPYGPDGNMLDQLYRWHEPSKIVMKPNAPFEAELELDSYRSYNTVKYTFKDVETGVTYPVFFSEFMDLVEEYGLAKGGRTPRLTWVAVKRGQAYSITPVK